MEQLSIIIYYLLLENDSKEIISPNIFDYETLNWSGDIPKHSFGLELNIDNKVCFIKNDNIKIF